MSAGLGAGALALAGIAAGPINPVLLTVYQERTPPELRGRVFGLASAIALSVMPIGRLASGYLIEAIGLEPTIVMGAAGYLTVGLVVLVAPVYGVMDYRPFTGSRQPVAW
jgi:MFS family permease